MSESGSLVTSGSSLGQGSLPLVLAGTQHENIQKDKIKPLPKLPSHRFRYSIWHELNSTSITGDQLKAPRIRDGPEIKDKFFYKIRDDTCRRIHHTRRGADRRNYQNQMENWENVTEANLSFQELHHRYQRENFVRVLKRLLRVEHLNLLHNEIVELSSVSFPCCTHLNLSTNYITSLKGYMEIDKEGFIVKFLTLSRHMFSTKMNLPKLPRIEELNLTDNYIHDLDGLKKLAAAPLTSLYLKGNPVSFSLNYRQRIFAMLTNLKMLDGIPRLPEDEVFEKEKEDEPNGNDQNEDSKCVIS